MTNTETPEALAAADRAAFADLPEERLVRRAAAKHFVRVFDGLWPDGARGQIIGNSPCDSAFIALDATAAERNRILATLIGLSIHYKGARNFEHRLYNHDLNANTFASRYANALLER